MTPFEELQSNWEAGMNALGETPPHSQAIYDKMKEQFDKNSHLLQVSTSSEWSRLMIQADNIFILQNIARLKAENLQQQESINMIQDKIGRKEPQPWWVKILIGWFFGTWILFACLLLR